LEQNIANFNNNSNNGNNNNSKVLSSRSLPSKINLETVKFISGKDDSNISTTGNKIAFSMGDAVDSLCVVQNGSERWFPGVIVDVTNESDRALYTIQFKDGDLKTMVPTDKIRYPKMKSRNGSVSSSPLPTPLVSIRSEKNMTHLLAESNNLRNSPESNIRPVSTSPKMMDTMQRKLSSPTFALVSITDDDKEDVIFPQLAVSPEKKTDKVWCNNTIMFDESVDSRRSVDNFSVNNSASMYSTHGILNITGDCTYSSDEDMDESDDRIYSIPLVYSRTASAKNMLHGSNIISTNNSSSSYLNNDVNSSADNDNIQSKRGKQSIYIYIDKLF
jgi:hypothetical protein